MRPVERHETFPDKCKFTLCRKYRVRLLSSTSKAVFYIKHNIRNVQDDKERLETKRNCIKRSEFTFENQLFPVVAQSFYPLRVFGENSSWCNLTGRLESVEMRRTDAQ